MLLLPNGKVFYTGQGSGGSNANSWIFNPTNRELDSIGRDDDDRTYGSVVLLPLLPPSYTRRS